MTETTKPFMWAHENNANIQEPLDALKQQGWRYGDVPAASNFNWLFKKISDEFADIKNELLAHKAENEKNHLLIAELKDELVIANLSISQTKDQLMLTNNEILSHKNGIEQNKAELDTAKKNHESLKTKTKERFERTFRNDDFNAGISRQICMLLRQMEVFLQRYHPDLPNQPWPMQEHAVSVAENEGALEQ